MAPRSFGKYEVLARLATGGAASIFLARQPGAAGFSKLVALKTLLAERATDEDFVAMFLDEARLAARLNHPNCVQIYDLGRVRGVYYISMEFIFGETLWNLLTTVTKVKVPLPPNSVAHIIAATCDGLNHAHDLKDGKGKAFNLVHRDVSPQNIMITFEGQTKVLDFGIAKAETGRAPTMAGIVKGKFSYMSPEQITGGQVDRRSDIYSLGIVMFECLASRRLYRGDSPEEIAKLILEHRAPRLRDVVPDIPKPLDEICARALARHPSKRYQSAHEMGEALRNYLDEARYAQTTSNLAKLLKERFGESIENRRQVFEGALAPQFDDRRLLELLDARAVRDVDLFPDEVPPEHEEDFMETGAVLGPVPGEVADSPRPDEISSSRQQGPGWRVELSSEGSDDVQPISVGSPAFLTAPAADSDATRLDEAGEGATVANLIEPNSDRTQLDGDNLDGIPLVQPAFPTFPEDTNEDGTDFEVKTADGRAPTNEPFDERTPLDPMAEASFGLPSISGAVEAIEARLDGLDADPDAGAGDTIDASDRAASSSSSPTDAAVPTYAPAAFVEPAIAALDPAQDPDPTPPPRIERVEPQTTGATPSPRPSTRTGERRFGIAALLAALGFGISVGLVVGMLLARMIFDLTPAQVSVQPGKVVELD